MKLLMHVLRKNKKLNIDNAKIGPVDIIVKLHEEFEEVIQAIVDYEENKTLHNLKEIIRETFDLIQMCILILWRCDRIAIDLDESSLVSEINHEHRRKIFDREWETGAVIGIEVKE